MYEHVLLKMKLILNVFHPRNKRKTKMTTITMMMSSAKTMRVNKNFDTHFKIY